MPSPMLVGYEATSTHEVRLAPQLRMFCKVRLAPQLQMFCSSMCKPLNKAGADPRSSTNPPDQSIPRNSIRPRTLHLYVVHLGFRHHTVESEYFDICHPGEGTAVRIPPFRKLHAFPDCSLQIRIISIPAFWSNGTTNLSSKLTAHITTAEARSCEEYQGHTAL
jgi:hypothetical protein